MILLPTASTEDIFCQIIVPKKSKPSNKTHEKNRLKWSHSAWPQLFANSSSLHKIQRAELRHNDVSLVEVSSIFLSTTRPHHLSSHTN